MKLIVGKENIDEWEIHHYMETQQQKGLNRSYVNVLWRLEGTIYPALVVFEESDFTEIIKPKTSG